MRCFAFDSTRRYLISEGAWGLGSLDCRASADREAARQSILYSWLNAPALIAAGKADKLKGFEIVKSILLDTEGFSVENDLLTPSFKLKRPQLQIKFQSQIDAMYVALGE